MINGKNLEPGDQQKFIHIVPSSQDTIDIQLYDGGSAKRLFVTPSKITTTLAHDKSSQALEPNIATAQDALHVSNLAKFRNSILKIVETQRSLEASFTYCMGQQLTTTYCN